MFLCRLLLAGMLSCLLVACGSRSVPPEFSASGYSTEQGVMRLWRKDIGPHPQVLLSVYTPLQGADTEVTRYDYLQGNLVQIRRNIVSKEPEEILLRFGRQGELAFMQRQWANRREKLEADDIARYRTEAQYLLERSTVLRMNGIRLLQGRWVAGQVHACAGERVELDLAPASVTWLYQRAQSSQQLGLAWLESPGGQQLLLVANEDFCRWEPQKNTL